MKTEHFIKVHISLHLTIGTCAIKKLYKADFTRVLVKNKDNICLWRSFYNGYIGNERRRWCGVVWCGWCNLKISTLRVKRTGPEPDRFVFITFSAINNIGPERKRNTICRSFSFLLFFYSHPSYVGHYKPERGDIKIMLVFYYFVTRMQEYLKFIRCGCTDERARLGVESRRASSKSLNSCAFLNTGQRIY